MENCNFESIYDAVKKSFGNVGIQRPELIPPITLAYIGDTVYDLFVRSYLISTTDCTVCKLHSMAVRLVCSSAQARAFHKIEHMLTEKELSVYKRGRNAHSTVPKNSERADYRTATGLEALIGYLFFSENDARISELMAEILDKKENKKEKNECLREN